MRTPIQQAIEALQIEMQKATEQHSPNIASGFHHSIIILQSFLPTEKEQITKAYKDGYIEGSSENEYTSTLITKYFSTHLRTNKDLKWR